MNIFTGDKIMGIEEEELELFRQFLHKKGLSENTITSYLGAVRQLHLLYPDPSPENLASYRQHLISSYQSATINARIYGINKYLQFLALQEGSRPARIPAFQMPVVKRQQVSFLNNVISNEDYEKLKNALRKEGKWFWYFVVHFLGSTGARVSELVQIKAEHLHLGYMDLYSKGGKVRRIYFPDSLCQEALAWLAEQDIHSGFLFLTKTGRPITPRGINSQLKVLARRFSIDPDTVYAHSFRHLYAKNFLKKYNDISLLADLLGHESIETTKIYLQQSSQEQKALLDRIVTW